MLTRRAVGPPAYRLDGSLRGVPLTQKACHTACCSRASPAVRAETGASSADDQRNSPSSLERLKASEAYKRLTSGSWREAYASQERLPASQPEQVSQQSDQGKQHETQQPPDAGTVQQPGVTSKPGSRQGYAASPVHKPAHFFGGTAGSGTPQQTVQRVSSASVGPRPRFGGGLARPMTRVRFWLNWHVQYGQNIQVVGSHENLGSWQLGQSLVLQWSEGDQWTAAVDLPAGRILEYKYVLVDSSTRQALSWQQGNNSVLALRQDDREVEVYDNWAGGPGAAVIASGQSSTRESRLVAWAEDIEQLVASQRGELRRSRMELIAAQDDARAAREETRRVKAELASLDAERQKNQMRVRELEGMNRLLRTQLQDSAASFRAALETAQRYLREAEHPSAVSPDKSSPQPVEHVPPPAASPAADVDALGSHREAAEGGPASLSAHASPLDDSVLADELDPIDIGTTSALSPEHAILEEAMPSHQGTNGAVSAAAEGHSSESDHQRLLKEAVQQSGRGNKAVSAAVPHKPGPFVEAQGLQRSGKPQQSTMRH